MPRKKSAKSRLWSFKQIELNGPAPVGLSPRPWISITIDPETSLLVEVQLADDPMLLLPDKSLWKQLRRWIWPGEYRAGSAKPLEARAKPIPRPTKTERTRARRNGSEMGQ